MYISGGKPVYRGSSKENFVFVNVERFVKGLVSRCIYISTVFSDLVHIFAKFSIGCNVG